ncbi:MAG: branched-chain amino acid ABC transporter substrate-binding protein [Burkholderiaceae bacterium]|nr:branched-chain amino acid ABC transporter substrate-binding protein [Burkholderiaceae bacterium]
MRKAFVASGMTVAVVLALVACGKKDEPKAAAPAAKPAAAAPAGNVIKIGHVGPTSGAIAHLGKDNENGARMAIEELNAKGVTIGGQKVTFELVAEDDAADPKQGTAVAQKLVDSKVAGVVGHLNSGTTIPASKIYSDAGIPQISPSATNPKYTRQGFKTAFRVVADDVQLGGVLGRYAHTTLKGKAIAVIDDRTAYGQGVAEEFEKAVAASGGKVIAHEFTNDKASDFMSILTSIKAKKPDVVFFGGMDAVAGPMLRQIKQLGMKVKFSGGDGICTTELAKLAGDAMADGQVVCAEAGGVDGEQKAGMDDFRAKFKAKYNADVQVYAPYVYDAVNVMVAAMVKANSADPAKYLPELAKTEGYKGVTGTISFDEKGDLKNGALTLYTYKGGKREQIAVVR